MKFCLLSFFLCLPLSVFGQQVTIAPYYGGRQAALSLTFDDGLLDQYTLAFPQLKSRGLKATFAIIGSKVGGIIRSKSDDLRDGSVRLTLNLNKGQNTIRLYNDNGPMPDIDYMQIDF